MWGRSLAWFSKISKNFGDFLEIDQNLTYNTIKIHQWRLKILCKRIHKPLGLITKENLREFLREMKSKYAVETYAGFIKTIRVFFRDFLGKPELATFKFPTKPFVPKILNFDKNDLQRFYHALKHPVVQMMFLLYCVSGLRRMDVLKLTFDEMDRNQRMIIKNNNSRTKHRWITFYNIEVEELLEPYLNARTDNNHRVFPISRCKTFQKHWRLAKERTGLNLTPKDLRDWFCVELTNLNVPDRYIDAYCGRIPKSILARHYTDYNPKRLKDIYDKANISVLS